MCLTFGPTPPLVGLAVTWLSACGFTIESGAAIDAPPISPDRPVDMGPTLMSCKEIKAAMPSAASGTYMIDPDGAGNGSAISVTCDMVTAGGGWTIIFFPTSANTMGPPVPYTVSSAPLMMASQDVLIGYRNSTKVAAPDFASFALPAAWRTDTPFNYPNSDITTLVSINDGTPASAMVRFGFQSFNSNCLDPWNGAQPSWGRVCVSSTRGPFFNGFASVLSDYCSDGTSNFSGAACSDELRFSIAVR